ncbi:serglycin-like [Choloepus didactylus]|uniref:serglycin-like n=1 Tax=Choloepus didactylus TaxID=27675 RepID=UPI00189D2B8F|nr:serglycin-like [Choloepus didactylus]
MRRARYQWVRCSPDSDSANCIEEKGPVFDLPSGESNRLLPPRTDSLPMARFPNVQDVFPLSEAYSGLDAGSGSGSGGGFLTEMEQEYEPVDEDDALQYNVQPFKRNLSLDYQDLDQDGSEDDFVI